MVVVLQVCKRWRAVAARNLLTLRPVIPKIHRFVTMFPSLTNLDLSGALLEQHFRRCGTVHVCPCRLMPVFEQGAFMCKALPQAA